MLNKFIFIFILGCGLDWCTFGASDLKVGAVAGCPAEEAISALALETEVQKNILIPQGDPALEEFRKNMGNILNDIKASFDDYDDYCESWLQSIDNKSFSRVKYGFDQSYSFSSIKKELELDRLEIAAVLSGQKFGLALTEMIVELNLSSVSFLIQAFTKGCQELIQKRFDQVREHMVCLINGHRIYRNKCSDMLMFPLPDDMCEKETLIRRMSRTNYANFYLMFPLMIRDLMQLIKKQNINFPDDLYESNCGNDCGRFNEGNLFSKESFDFLNADQDFYKFVMGEDVFLKDVDSIAVDIYRQTSHKDFQELVSFIKGFENDELSMGLVKKEVQDIMVKPVAANIKNKKLLEKINKIKVEENNKSLVAQKEKAKLFIKICLDVLDGKDPGDFASICLPNNPDWFEKISHNQKLAQEKSEISAVKKKKKKKKKANASIRASSASSSSAVLPDVSFQESDNESEEENKVSLESISQPEKEESIFDLIHTKNKEEEKAKANSKGKNQAIYKDLAADDQQHVGVRNKMLRRLEKLFSQDQVFDYDVDFVPLFKHLGGEITHNGSGSSHVTLKFNDQKKGLWRPHPTTIFGPRIKIILRNIFIEWGITPEAFA